MKTIILSLIFGIASCLSTLNVNAQAMLKGDPSFENFIGSPAMWVIGAGLMLLALIVVFFNRKKKFQPDTLEINQQTDR